MPTGARLNILSLDGGGVRGIVAATTLLHVERQTEQPVHELFDLVAGTSAGALVALLLTTPEQNGKLPRDASQTVQAFSDHAARIFPLDPLRGGPRRPRPYSQTPVKQVARRLLGEHRLSDCVVPVLVPTYDMAAAKPYVFDSALAQHDPSQDRPLVDVVLSAIAAPFYFQPSKLLADDEHPHSRLLIDGGVFANNPALIALRRGRQIRGNGRPKVLSVSTGGHTRLADAAKGYDWKNPKRLGRSLADFIGLVFDANSGMAHELLHSELPEEDYYRVEIQLPANLDSLDDSREETLAALQAQVEPALRGERFKRFLGSLVEN